MKYTVDKSKLFRYLLLLIAALLWGFSFVVQAVDEIAPFTFTATRSLIGATVLVPVFLIKNAIERKKGLLPNLSLEERKKSRRTLLLGGAICGTLLAIANNLQQIGLSMNLEAGKAGFITALYIVLVPIIGFFIGKRSPFIVWISVAIAVVGLYFICVRDSFTINTGDVCLIFCAFAFAAHITVVDRFVDRIDGVKLSCLQFLVCGILSLLVAVIFERARFSWTLLLSFYPAFLYMGICSCGIAYTLQILGQKGTNPTAASLIMSLESCFSLISGMIVLSERPDVRGWIGMGLMVVAIVLTESKELFRQKVAPEESAPDSISRHDGD